MSDSSLADSIFHKWKIDLRNKNRSKQFISSNFDELVSSWKSANIDKDTVFPLMKDAIKEHYPPRSISKAVYKKGKQNYNGLSEDEFISNWESMIESEAYQVFYLYYPLVQVEKQQIAYGSMSKQEYLKQMQYAKTHPEVDIEKVREQRRKTLINMEQ